MCQFVWKKGFELLKALILTSPLGLVGLLVLSAKESRWGGGGFKRLNKSLHSLDSNCSPVFNDYLVNLGVASDIQVRVNSAGRMDVRMSAVATTASLDAAVSDQACFVTPQRESTYISIDPFQPRLKLASIASSK